MVLESLEPRLLSNASILEIWEKGAALSGSQKSRLLLAVGYPQASVDLIDRSPLGAWNVALLRLREWQIGSNITLIDRCPECSETIEFVSSTNDLLAADSPPTYNSNKVLAFRNWELTHRSLFGSDLIESETDQPTDPIDAGKSLIERTILKLTRNGNQANPRDMSASLWEKLASSISEYDSLSEIVFNLSCPKCGHNWESLFEPGEHLWIELSAKAKALLYEIHVLAIAYSWRESEILKLSDDRRAAYLSLIEEHAATPASIPQQLGAI
ncbi:MAG: hypothetical protein F6K19_51205 [Cyanothece sp. SIO1E1]|nr:hypothetical protein [Cyanothece sp. SIO1E1]